MSDYTTVVQGPFDEHSLNNLKNYAKFGPVIVVGWTNATTDLLAQATAKCHEVGAQLITLPTTPTEHLLNPQNIYRQACTTAAGLARVETTFAAKVRSDESYEDLSEMIARLHREPSRVWASSVFFRCDRQHKFHCGDHIVAGNARLLQRGFERVRDMCQVMPPVPLDWQPLPEVLLTRAMLIAKGIQPIAKRSRDQMAENFGPLSLKLFGKLACKIHLPHQKIIKRQYITCDDRGLLNGSGRCVHDSIDEL